MASVDEAVKRLRIEYEVDGLDEAAASLAKVEQAYARVQAQQKQYQAANDNLSQSVKAANDNYLQFGKNIVDIGSGVLETVSHLKLLALGAYALSPAFRSFTNSGISIALTQLGANAGLFASAMARVVSIVGPAFSFLSRLAVPITALVVAWQTLTAVISRGSSLLDKYGSPAGNPAATDALTKLTAFQQDSISLEQVKNATELGARLKDAKQTISDFFKVQFDLTTPALALQRIWVNIVETIASGVRGVNQLLSLVGLGPSATTPPENIEQTRALGLNKLKAAMGGGLSGRIDQSLIDLANPPKPEAAARSDAYDRQVQSIQDQIKLLKLEADGVGKTTQAYQEAKVAHELTIAAMKAGIPVTDKMREEWKQWADQIADWLVKANQARVLQEAQFQGATQFLSPAEQAAANAARQIDPTNWVAHLKDAGPQLAYVNQQLRTAADLSFNFLDTFNQGLLQGKSTVDSLKDALRGLESQLLQMVEKQAINSLFAGLFRAGGIGAPADLSGSSNPGWLASLATGSFIKSANGNAFMGGSIIPFAQGGIIGGPTIFPMANGAGLMGEAGPEAVMPLRRGSDGRLGVAGGGTQVNVSVINQNGSDVAVSQSQDNNGNVNLSLLVRDAVNRNLSSGNHDAALRGRFGLHPNKVR